MRNANLYVIVITGCAMFGPVSTVMTPASASDAPPVESRPADPEQARRRAAIEAREAKQAAVREWTELLDMWMIGLRQLITVNDKLHADSFLAYGKEWRSKVLRLTEFDGDQPEPDDTWSALDLELLTYVRLARKTLPLFTDRTRPVTDRVTEMQWFLAPNREQWALLVTPERQKKWNHVSADDYSELAVKLQLHADELYRGRYSRQDVRNFQVRSRANQLFSTLVSAILLKNNLIPSRQHAPACSRWEARFCEALLNAGVLTEAPAPAELLAKLSPPQRSFYEYLRVAISDSILFQNLDRQITDAELAEFDEVLGKQLFTPAEASARRSAFAALEAEIRRLPGNRAPDQASEKTTPSGSSSEPKPVTPLTDEGQETATAARAVRLTPTQAVPETDNMPTTTVPPGLSSAEKRQVATARWWRQLDGRLSILAAAALLVTAVFWAVIRRRSGS